MNTIRRFGDLFIKSCLISTSLYTRTLLPMALFLMTAISISIRDRGVVFVAYGYSIVVFALCLCKNLLRSLRGLALPAVFILMGFAIHVLSKILGYPTPSVYTLALSSFKLALAFLSIALFFQWIEFRELRYVLTRVGLGKVASYITMALTIIPLLSYLYSESYVAAVLKFGKRKAHKAVKPLVIQSAILAKDLAQAIYFYGLPKSNKVLIKKPSFIEVSLLMATIIAGAYLLASAP